MSVTARGPGLAERSPTPFRSTPADRLAAHLDSHDYDRPTLVIDIDRVAARFRTLADAMPGVHIHYAVKANPAPEILTRIVALGGRFDAASMEEIRLCLAAGAPAGHITFGNTVKRPADIRFAHAAGITVFAADAPEELEKIAAHAPGARVILRLLVETTQADWPLSRKFGAPADALVDLMARARRLGLVPDGLSFHVGSQTRQAAMWRPILAEAAEVWHAAHAAGYPLSILNLGGGFPAPYLDPVQDTGGYGADLMAMVGDLFGAPDYLMIEPGRGLVAEAGVISAEVLLVARRRPSDIARWVYLDIGKFSGLAETIDEAIRYRIETTADGGETGPCVLAGPSCDSADVLYERRPVQLPLALRAGDRVRIHAAGAYTSSYASVGFNGFPPLAVVCI